MTVKTTYIKPMIIQLFSAGLYSFVGLNIDCLLYFLMTDTTDHLMPLGIWGDYLICSILIAVWLNPLNILLILLLHYLKIFSFFIYENKVVFVESCLFGIIYGLLQGDDFTSIFIDISLTYFTIVGLAIMFRIVLKKQYLRFKLKWRHYIKNLKINTTLLTGEK